jgi:hypothetical protein
MVYEDWRDTTCYFHKHHCSWINLGETMSKLVDISRGGQDKPSQYELDYAIAEAESMEKKLAELTEWAKTKPCEYPKTLQAGDLPIGLKYCGLCIPCRARGGPF